MSIRNAGVFDIIVSTKFVEDVVPEELKAIRDILEEADELTLDDIGMALQDEDEEELASIVGEEYCDALIEANKALHRKFLDTTGLTLFHLQINSDRDESELEDGHYFTLAFSEVYQQTPAAKTISQHLSLETWCTCVG